MLLNDRLTQAMASAYRHHTALAALFVDVDRFKHINDTRGPRSRPASKVNRRNAWWLACAVRILSAVTAG